MAYEKFIYYKNSLYQHVKLLIYVFLFVLKLF